MKTKVSFFLVFSLFITSCKINSIMNYILRQDEVEQNVEEKQYIPDIAWELNTNAYIESYPVQEGKYLYFQEYNIETDEVNIAKVDLSDGRYIWTSDTIPYGCTYGGYVADNYYCIFDARYNLRIFDKFSGKLLTTIVFSEIDYIRKDYAPYTTAVFFYDGSLYWGNAATSVNIDPPITRGIMKLDFQRIDLSLENQIIIPKSVYERCEGEGSFSSSFIIDGEILYGLCRNPNYFKSIHKDGAAILIAFDINTFNVKWRKQLDGICGFNTECIKLENNKLFVFDDKIYCFDINSGECIYKKEQTESDLKKEINLTPAMDLCGIFQHNGKFYYTRGTKLGDNEALGLPEKYNKNIICWDGNTFKLSWADLPPYKNGADLQTRPVVVNGKCFVVTNTGLRVYDAETGEFLGVWKDILNLGWDRNAYYEDLFIFFNHDETTEKGILTAIKAK